MLRCLVLWFVLSAVPLGINNTFSTQDDTTKCFAGSKEVNDSISQKVNSEQDIEDLLTTICTQGLNLVEEKALLSRAAMEQRLEEAVEDIDLTPSLGAPGTDNDPVRIYLREMGASSLLTREGEVDLAKWIERGQLSTLKALTVTHCDPRSFGDGH